MNFARDVVDAAPGADRALVEIDAVGARREWTFAEVSDVSARLAGTFVARGVRRGDMVMTLIGSRPQWVLSMVACFRIGAVALPCNEQLRAKDLRMRIDAAAPRLIVCDERNAGELSAALAGVTDPPDVILIPDPSLLESEPAPAVELAPTDPCLITFTSGTTGAAKGIVHGQRYLPGQALQASTWLGAQRGDLVWCTAASGWSKSARNAFIAPWLQGAAALLHDARFDPEQRLALLASERVNVLCMAPTEYRVIAKRATLAPVPSLRGLVAAGEALNPEVLRMFEDGIGLPIRDGYGQTETGQLTGVPAGGDVRPGSMGQPLPGVALEVLDGELVLTDPTTDPTFFVGYLDGEPAPERRAVAHRRPGHRRRRRLPVLRGPHRRRDHLLRLPDRAHSRSSRRSSPTRPSPRRPRSPRPTTSAARWSARSSSCATASSPPTRSSQSSRTTSRPRPRPTSTRGSSTSPPSCRRPPAARCSGRCCVHG